MKIRLTCNSGANIHSARKEVIDTVEDWGMDEGKWESMGEDEKQALVDEWAYDRLEIFWEAL